MDLSQGPQVLERLTVTFRHFQYGRSVVIGRMTRRMATRTGSGGTRTTCVIVRALQRESRTRKGIARCTLLTIRRLKINMLCCRPLRKSSKFKLTCCKLATGVAARRNSGQKKDGRSRRPATRHLQTTALSWHTSSTMAFRTVESLKRRQRHSHRRAHL